MTTLLNRRALLLLAALGLAACSDAAPTAEPTQDMLPPVGDMNPLPQADRGVNPTQDQGTTPVLGARELRVVSDAAILMERGARTELRLQLVGFDINTQAERPVAGERIRLKLLDENGVDQTANGVEGSILESAARPTGDDGIAAFNLVAGQRDVSFEVEASVDGADDIDPVYIRVNVVRPGQGVLDITVNYASNPRRYENDLFNSRLTARVSLFANQGQGGWVAGPNCATLRTTPTELPPAYFAQDIDPYTELDNQLAIDDTDGNSFTVVATLLADSDMDGTFDTVGFGCFDNAAVVGGQRAQVEVNVLDLPLAFGKPEFRVRNELDLISLLESTRMGDVASAVPESLGVVAEIIRALAIIGSDDPDRGEALVRLACDLLDAGGLCDALAGVGGALVNRLLDQLPENVQNILTIISDVFTIAGELTIIGELEFAADLPNMENRLEGENLNRWQRFRVVWRNGCMQAPCERDFPIRAASQNQEVIEGRFDARLEGDKIIIEPHGLRFRYGLLLLAIMEQWVLPAVLGDAGPITLQDALGTLLEGPCQSVDDVLGQGACQDVLVGALGDVIVDQVARLQFEPEQFRIRGEALYADTDGDLRVDRLNGGVWLGTVEIGTNDVGQPEELDFLGCFSACRDPSVLPEGQQPCEPADCVIPNMAP
ncbi:MAG: hypothetical protein KC613_22410 [Myxococcales bacterium]|nr:hypothetical protein [Myxococcales bacterium]MCB9526495.1 hypothetical protein [Myxococcales bacterium]